MYAAAIAAMIELVRDLIARGQQSGELSDQQAADLQMRAISIFLKYGSPAPPPPDPAPTPTVVKK